MAATLYVVQAIAIGDRVVLVELSKPPRALSTIGQGDALNPRTWHVQRLDTGAELTVLGVLPVTLGTVFQLYTLKKFAAALIKHRVSAPTLVDPNGNLITSPDHADFDGCEASVPAEVEGGLVDLASIQTAPDSFAATLRVLPGGDYATESGMSLLRKLVIRRLTTAPNEFFFLDPSYGLGLRVKEPLRVADLNLLRAEAIRQLQQEPEFGTVDVQLSLGSNGVLTVEVRATLARTNGQVQISIPVPTTFVQL
jgi:hypothetical protein